MNIKIHHIGYAVKDINEAIHRFKLMNYTVIGECIRDNERGICVQFVKNGDYLIELVMPARTNSPVDSYILNYKYTPYHICYEVDDIRAVIDKLKEEGYKLICCPKPAPAINNRKVAFLYSKGIGLIEIIDGGSME